MDTQNEAVVESQEPAAVETEAAPSAKPEVDLSAQFAELKRRDRALLAEKNKIKANAEQEKAAFIAELKANPLAKLQELGISSAQLADVMLGYSPAEPSHEDVLQKKLAELEAWKQEQEDARNRANQQDLIESYRKEVFSGVESEGDKYELLLKHPNGRNLYWDSVLSYYQSYGEAPGKSELADIAQQVEDHLYDQHKQLLGLKKFAPKVEAKPEEKQPVSAEAKSKATLSNSTLRPSYSAPKMKIVENGRTQTARSSYDAFMQERQEKLAKLLK